jgi:hypothetical protein
MRPFPAFFACLLLLAAPAAAQDWRPAPEQEILLTTWDIEPSELRLKADRPVRLRFVNTSNQALAFSAKGFFRKAERREQDGDSVKDGRIEVPALSSRTMVLVPRAGRYRVQGGSIVHRILGMGGRIIVD